MYCAWIEVADLNNTNADPNPNLHPYPNLNPNLNPIPNLNPNPDSNPNPNPNPNLFPNHKGSGASDVCACVFSSHEPHNGWQVSLAESPYKKIRKNAIRTLKSVVFLSRGNGYLVYV